MGTFPEINLAKRLIAKYGLTPPIDIENLTKQYADVDHLAIPFEVDGITLHLKTAGRRPKIILNSSIAVTRMRFTLAHELGHVLIPWHVGNIVDITNENDVYGDDYSIIESEANRFASELLMPHDWIRQIILTTPDPPRMVKSVTELAQVSSHAAIIKLATTSDPGNLFAAISDDGQLLSSGRSDGTLANLPSWGEYIDPTTLFPFCNSRYAFTISGQNYFWWKFSNDAPIPDNEDSRTWQEVLSLIIEQSGADAEHKRKLWQRISGIIGYANSQLARDYRTASNVYSACLQRMHSSEEMTPIKNHPLFELFLRKKVQSLINRK